MPHVIVKLYPGRTEEQLPEMLEFMYYMIREQSAGAGALEQDTQVLVTDGSPAGPVVAGPLPPSRTIHVLRQMCASLAEAHDAGLVHRDIKPANVFLCRLGREVDHVKVLDFGLVKEISGPGDAHLTQVGTFAGTPAFGSPEAAAGRVDRIGPASDIYSIGCLAYWLLTGETVFKASGAMEMLASHIREAPAPPSERTEVPLSPEVDRVVLRCLEKDPDARIGSADELDALLADLASECPWTMEQARAWWVMHRPERVA